MTASNFPSAGFWLDPTCQQIIIPEMVEKVLDMLNERETNTQGGTPNLQRNILEVIIVRGMYYSIAILIILIN